VQNPPKQFVATIVYITYNIDNSQKIKKEL